MSLRWKIAFSLAAISLVATASVGIVSYRSTAERLLAEVDRSIGQVGAQVRLGGRVAGVPARGELGVYGVRILSANGSVLASSFDPEIPVDPDVHRVLGEQGATVRATASVGGEHLRIHTIGVPGGAVQVTRSLDEVDRVLDDLRRRTVLLVVVVAVAAATIGWVIASGVAAPLRRLTRAAEDVGASGELDVEVEGNGSDEVGRLAVAFREMLDALARSRLAQQRLVDDAGHELRTPLTSLRTNLAVLRRHDDLSDETRANILSDLDDEITELTELVDELVTVAGGDQPSEPVRPIELEPLVRDAAARVGRRRDRELVVTGSHPATVRAAPAAVERAVINLIDNACKFDESGGPIEVVVEGGAVRVLDRGPGVGADGDQIFDRFYRAESARSLPGSGLGLAIVAGMAERAGGSVFALDRPGGGAEVGFRLPPIDGRSSSQDCPETGGAEP